MKLSRNELAKMIDHTLVRPTATKDEVIKLCWEAEKYGLCCVVVDPFFVSLARHMLEATEVKVCSTVGFPIGAVLPEVKAFEARKVVELGAEEIDMVMNTSALKSKDYEAVKEEIGVKAAGGIRTLEQTLAMIKAGANRIGTSTAVNILEEMPKK